MIEIETSYEDEIRFINIGRITTKFYTVVTHTVKIKSGLFLYEDREKRRLKSMKTEEFDKIFDDNEEDIIEYLDLSKIKRPNLETVK